jgi:Rrf2 family protein
MKITKEEDYAILFMSILAVRKDRLLSLQEISDDFNIPYYFLKKIARGLKESRLVIAKEGAAGGYALAMPAQEITLADIIESIRGPLALVDCADNSANYCPAEDFCLASTVMKRVSRDIRKIFSEVKLTDMIATSPVIKMMA